MGSSFLTGLPTEIREEIYKCVLRDDRLSNADQARWNVAPSILRTCRQIYNEAKSCFYEVNTFAYLVSEEAWANEDQLCPINLKHNKFSLLKSLEIHIDSWKVDKQGNDLVSYPKIMARLCRTLHRSKDLKITIKLGKMSIYLASQLNNTLRPVHLLRNVKSFEFLNFLNCTQDILDLINDLTQQVTGDSPVQPAFKMYDALRAYAHTFERDVSRRKFMEADVRWGLTLQQRTYAESHPVRDYLRHARASALTEDLVSFKLARSAVLEGLEDQYQRLLDAWPEKFGLQLSGLQGPYRLIRPPGILPISFKDSQYFEVGDDQNNHTGGSLAFVELESMASLYAKEVGTRGRQQCHLTAWIDPIDTVYKTMARETALSKLKKAAIYEETLGDKGRAARRNYLITDTNYDWTRCRYYWLKALKDMLIQFMEIRAARENLFCYDARDEPERSEYDVEGLPEITLAMQELENGSFPEIDL